MNSFQYYLRCKIYLRLNQYELAKKDCVVFIKMANEVISNK